MEEGFKSNNIKSFLSRFKKLGSPNRKIKELFISELYDKYKIEVQGDQVRVLKNHIYIRTTPIKKTEIIKRKEQLIHSLKEQLSLDFLDIN